MLSTTMIVKMYPLKRKSCPSHQLVNIAWFTVFLLLHKAKAATTTTATSHILDLSYHQHVKVDVLAPALRQHLWKDHHVQPGQQPQQQDLLNSVRIDLSNSLLGDEGLKALVESLLPQNNDDDNNRWIQTNHQVSIQLALRMNQLTYVGVTKLFQTILAGPKTSRQQKPQQQQQPNPESESTTTSTISGDEQVNDDAKVEVVVKVDHSSPSWVVESLDLSWNDLSSGDKTFLRALNQLLANTARCPRVLRLDLCGLGPAACRAMAKGIIQRFDQPPTKSTEAAEKNDEAATSLATYSNDKLLTLHLSGNDALGDAGAATLAAAIRTVAIKKIKARKRGEIADKDVVALEKLNLSACSIGDAGLEALSLAFETHPRCVLALDLSNNRISDTGVAALGRALLSSVVKPEASTATVGFDELDLSNNADLGDRGASILADCLQKGMARNLVLRSCHIRADGAVAFGRALRRLCKSQSPFLPVSLDLSGNSLGVLRGKSTSSGKYSASRLKSKASATTASYMNFLSKKIRSGLKDVVGVDVMGASANSDEDDEDEGAENKGGGKNQDSDVDASEARCGVKALANAFLEDDAEDRDDQVRSTPLASNNDNIKRRCHVALRHSSLDHAAADALAAAVLHAKDEYGIDLVVDVSLNPVLEDEMVSALRGDGDEYYLREMAERHNDAMSALRQAQRRAKEVAATVIARSRVEDTEWNLPDVPDDDEEETWDSDADYEDEGED